jgi:hypothetical protein
VIQYAIRSRNLLNWAAFLLLRFTVVIHDKIMVNLANKMLILLHLVYEALPISDLLVGVLATLSIHLRLQFPDQLSTFLVVSPDPDLFLTSHLLQLADLSLHQGLHFLLLISVGFLEILLKSRFVLLEKLLILSTYFFFPAYKGIF